MPCVRVAVAGNPMITGRLALGAWFVCWLVTLAAPAPRAQTKDPDPTRFEAEIEAFRGWDQKNAVPSDGVLFVGSSTIRLWNTAERFPNLAIINRGFGGSHISDVNHYIRDVALKYRPATVVFYAGDNDVNDGKTVDQVLEDYREFVRQVVSVRPDVRIHFLAIKPSPSRGAKWNTMRLVNERVAAFSAGYNTSGAARLHVIDVASPMLTRDGQTQAGLYVDDGLHLSVAGYDMWTRIVSEALAATPR